MTETPSEEHPGEVDPVENPPLNIDQQGAVSPGEASPKLTDFMRAMNRPATHIASIASTVMPDLSAMTATKVTPGFASLMKDLAPTLTAMAAARKAAIMPSTATLSASIASTVMPDLSAMTATKVTPRFASLMKDLAPTLTAMAAARKAAILPSTATLSAPIASTVIPPFASAAMKRALYGGQLGSAFGAERVTAAYITAMRTLLTDLDIPDFDAASITFGVGPTRDSSAYKAIEIASPETAAAIDNAAALVRTPFWSREVVRNALAWFLASLIALTYVAGSVLFSPWGLIVVALLSAEGVTGPAVYRKVAAPGISGEPDERQSKERR